MDKEGPEIEEVRQKIRIAIAILIFHRVLGHASPITNTIVSDHFDVVRPIHQAIDLGTPSVIIVHPLDLDCICENMWRDYAPLGTQHEPRAVGNTQGRIIAVDRGHQRLKAISKERESLRDILTLCAEV